MKRILLLMMVCLFMFSNTFPQIDKSQKELLKKVLSSEEYICGTGHGNTLREAEENALSSLAGQISVTVSSKFEYIAGQTTKNNNINFDEQIKSIVKTYSHTTLRNALEIIVKDEPDAEVVRYIKAVDVDKLFESRKDKAISYAKSAERYEQEGKVGDALSYYYWSLVLLRSCPSGDQLKITFGLNDERQLIPYIYSKIKDILSNVKMSMLSNTLENDGTRTIGLKVDYKGKPAANLNYTYFNGTRRSDISTLQNGEDAIFIPASMNLKKLDIRAEYCCEEEANMDAELRDVLNNTRQAPLQIAKIQLMGINDVAQVKEQSSEPQMKMSTAVIGVTNMPIGGTSVKYLDEKEAGPYLVTMQQVEQALRKKDFLGVKELFTAEGFEMFEKLIHYGNARLIHAPNVRFSRFGNEVTCRSFPMNFSFKTNRKTFSENVVFRLNEDAKITEVAFGLEERATLDIMNNGSKRYSEEARQVLVSFLESYKTEYALCRLDYLDKIFSNDALIITGTLVKSTGTGELKPKLAQHVKYTRQSKSQYLKNLKRTMQSNEYINIHFADNLIYKSTGKEIYGIQIKQDYFSSSYGDTGYLFLLLDLTKVDEPLVKVRAWQPDLDPSIPDGRLNISDFIL